MASSCPGFFPLSLLGVLAWDSRPLTTTSSSKLFFTRSLAEDSVHRDLCSKTDFLFPYFRWREEGATSLFFFFFGPSQSFSFFFFLSLVTECKHLLAFTLTHILYFLRQAVRNWPILLFCLNGHSLGGLLTQTRRGRGHSLSLSPQ